MKGTENILFPRSIAEPASAQKEPEAPAPHSPAAALAPAGQRGMHPMASGAPVVFSRVVATQPDRIPTREVQRLADALDEGDPVLDQLRSLAATLHQARTDREIKVLAITSSVSGEGKTLLAANLALTLSRSYGRQVLLIDADLRRPGQQALFGLSTDDGIRSALEAVTAGEAVSVQEIAPRMALLPAGKAFRDPVSVLETHDSLEDARILIAGRRYAEAYEMLYRLRDAGVAVESAARELAWICDHWDRIDESNSLRIGSFTGPEQLVLRLVQFVQHLPLP